ncbi:MAG TPA: hypothetical protein VJ851_00705 [Jatrophihabitans sp.]|nr:hypothetical protein [Jatrophihabitans sp.]
MPEPLADGERALVRGWLRVHSIDPRRVKVTPSGALGVGADVAVISHPQLGALIVYGEFQLDEHGRKTIDPLTRRPAVRVVAQPLGMPPPPLLRDRGNRRAAEWRLRLPVSALLPAA